MKTLQYNIVFNPDDISTAEMRQFWEKLIEEGWMQRSDEHPAQCGLKEFWMVYDYDISE